MARFSFSFKPDKKPFKPYKNLEKEKDVVIINLEPGKRLSHIKIYVRDSKDNIIDTVDMPEQYQPKHYIFTRMSKNKTAESEFNFIYIREHSK